MKVIKQLPGTVDKLYPMNSCTQSLVKIETKDINTIVKLNVMHELHLRKFHVGKYAEVNTYADGHETFMIVSKQYAEKKYGV